MDIVLASLKYDARRCSEYSFYSGVRMDIVPASLNFRPMEDIGLTGFKGNMMNMNLVRV